MNIVRAIKNAVPQFIVHAPGGGGKITLQPNYLISQSPDKVVLRNFEGVITTYPEPENCVPGRAEGYFGEVYPNYGEKKSNVGIAGLMNDEKPYLVPEGLQRLEWRKQYETNPEHASLKDKREKRDLLKEKKFQSQLKKMGDGTEKEA